MRKMKLPFFVLFLILFSFSLKTNIVKASEGDTCAGDTIKPLISGYKDEWILLKGSELPDFSQNVIAKDNCDQNPTLIILTQFINTDLVGTHHVIYRATDKNLNETEVTVDVIVKDDITKPQLVGLKSIELEVFSNLTDELFLSGITAIDNFDGDITDRIIVDYSKVNPNMVGGYDVSYTVTDSNLNTITNTITINIVDKTKPAFTINPPEIEVYTKSINLLDYIDVEDNYDENPVVTITHSVNLNKVGSYFVYYNIKDKSGNESEALMTLKVVDTTKPIIEVNNIEIAVFGEVNWKELIKVSDNYDTNLIVMYDASNVNYHVLGTYHVNYTVIDASSNKAEKSIQVNVVDKVKPIIKNVTNFNVLINSAKPNWINNIYVEDNYDKIINNQLVSVNDQDVHFNKEGVYPLSYSVMDSSGNSTTVTVNVRVYDHVPPVFSGLHDFNIATTSENIDFLSGVTAHDNLNGDITNKIFYDDSNVKYHVYGVYQLRYFVTDLSGNVTEAFVNVDINYDFQKPIIFGMKNQTIEVNFIKDDWLAGIYAFDDYDDEVIIHVDLSQFDQTKIGDYKVTYQATDKAGNTKSETIDVKVEDTTSPVISGHKNQTVEINGSLDLLNGVTVTDNSGEVIQISVNSHVKLNKLGTYQVTYLATDSSGNSVEEIINVSVVDTTKPVISGQRNRTVEINGTLDVLYGVSVTDNSGETLQINVDSQVDLTQLDIYQVTYSATDSSGNRVEHIIFVTVVDTTKPVISGHENMTVEVNEEMDLIEGITVTDNSGEVIELLVESHVDFSQLDTYQVTYSAVDSSGNRVEEVIHVTVLDTTSPVLDGVSNREIKKGETFNPLEGITASDNGMKSDLTSQIVVTSDYNLKKVGTYTITLTVTDDSGNTTTTNYTLTVTNNSLEIIKTVSIVLSIVIGCFIILGIGFYMLNKKYKWINISEMSKKIFRKK